MATGLLGGADEVEGAPVGWVDKGLAGEVGVEVAVGVAPINALDGAGAGLVGEANARLPLTAAAKLLSPMPLTSKAVLTQ